MEDLAKIDEASEKLNQAWQSASQDIYQATQGEDPTAGADPGAGGDQEASRARMIERVE